MEFILDDTKPQLSDDLTGGPQLVSADGVTYRVVQVSADGSAISDGTSVQLVGGNGVTFQNGDIPAAPAPFYVMMSSDNADNVITVDDPPRIIVPSKSPAVSQHIAPRITKTARDERRRATHNEVERRRRDKINLWIKRLSRIIPDCQGSEVAVTAASAAAAAAKNQSLQSKGGILSKACDYIAQLKLKADKHDEVLKDYEQLREEANELRHKYDLAMQENAILKQGLAEAGLHLNIVRRDVEPEATSTTPQHSATSYDDACMIDESKTLGE